MPNTIRPSLASEVEAIAELAIDPSQKQALNEIAQTLSVRPPNSARPDELKAPLAVDDDGDMPALAPADPSRNADGRTA